MQNFNLNPKWITKNPEDRLYKIPVPIIGLTGGIGTGKSTVAKMLRAQNIPVIDADALVKIVYQKNEIKNFIKENFTDAIANDVIDFKKLRQIAFTSPANIIKIETEIYKYLPETFIAEFKKFSSPTFIVYDVPLLFEKGLDQFVDLKVCVYSYYKLQIERLMKRDQIDKATAEKIINHQLNIEDKKKISQLVIENNSDLYNLEANFNNFLQVLKNG